MSAITKASGHGISVSGGVQINGLGEVFRLAAELAKARGFVPKAYVGQPESIAAAMLTGIELGIGPMESLRSLHVVDGKPTMAADFMLARAIRAGVRHQWICSDANEARVALNRDGFERQEFTFTMKDAQSAGLANKDNWRKYPAAMLRARCISAALRAYCPDVLGSGIYTPEELGARVDESGAPVDAMPLQRAPARTAAPPPADVVDAEPEPAAESGAPTRMDECRTAEELAAWIRERWPLFADGQSADWKQRAAAKVVEHGARIGVSADDIGVWLGRATPAPAGEEGGE